MKEDYQAIAQFYDVGTGLSQGTLRMWLDLIVESGGKTEGARALDLGCGTGRFTLPMARELGYRPVGVDSSPEMLEKAKEKVGACDVEWGCMDAADLCYSDASFDLVFMSHLLHHIDDPAAVLAECYRVSRPDSSILVRFGAMENIREDAVHTLFPESIDIDQPRTPTVAQLEQLVSGAGYSQVQSREVVQRTHQSGEDYLKAIRAKHISVLTLMSDQAFEIGVTRLAERVEANPSDPWLLHNSLTLTTGYKK